MNICQFRASPPHLQHALVKAKGVFLLKTCSGASTSLLYQLDDFYVELLCTVTYASRGIIRCLSVNEIKPYLHQIDISGLHPLLQVQGKAT